MNHIIRIVMELVLLYVAAAHSHWSVTALLVFMTVRSEVLVWVEHEKEKVDAECEAMVAAARQRAHTALQNACAA